MASIASLPAELVAHILRLAVGPITSQGWSARRDALSWEAGPLVDVLVVSNENDDFDGRDQLGALVQACPAVRVLSLQHRQKLCLNPLAGLARLEHLTIASCGIALAPDLVLPRLTTLALQHTIAERACSRTLFSSSCLPQLRHLQLAYGAGPADVGDGARPDELVFTRPSAEFVSQLVSIEHGDSSRCRRYGTTRDGSQNSLFVADVRFLSTWLAAIRFRGCQVHHLRVELAAAHVACGPLEVANSVQQALQALVAGVTGTGEYAKCLSTLRTLFLPVELHDHPVLRKLLVPDPTSSSNPVKVDVVFFDVSFEQDEPLGALSPFMRLAEVQQAVAR
ncbi:hypothetical protein JCM10449v2_002365 [Rhodotorula kratochvilovae]